VRNAKETDSEVDVKEIPFENGRTTGFWEQVVQPYEWVLYISQDGNVNELRELNGVCKEERKVFLPAICLGQVALAGPVVHPETDGCWESAWRRLHQSAIGEAQQAENFSSTSGAILANVLGFEFFKKAAGIEGTTQSNQIYMLDPETLEGNWLSFISHPLVTSENRSPRLLEDLDVRIEQEQNRNAPPGKLLDYFSMLTSEEIGIFHTWEERDLIQLPLQQCFVQAVNPVSKGPAELLPEVICAGFTHEEAKRNAGLTGIEMYVSQLIESDNLNAHVGSNFIGIGAGETIEEAVCRGLQSYLDKEIKQRKEEQQGKRLVLQEGSIEDRQCKYFLNALTTLTGPSLIELKEEFLGFPVIQVRSNGRCYTKAGLDLTHACRNALTEALLDTQNEGQSMVRHETEPADFLGKKESKLSIPSSDELTQLELLQSSIQALRENGKRLFVYDLSFEPFLKEGLAGVFGVQVLEEGS